MTFLDLIPLLANEAYTVFQNRTLPEQYYIHWNNNILILDKEAAKEWARYFDTHIESKAETTRQIQEDVDGLGEQVERFDNFVKEDLGKAERYLTDRWKVLDLNFGFEERV